MVKDSSTEKQRRWEQHYSSLSTMNVLPTPSRVLADYQYLLPSSGRALDVACGLAGNGFLLAQQGLETCVWDSSESAIAQVAALSKFHRVNLESECRDVERNPPSEKLFDVIVVSRFLSRPLCTALIKSLRPQGLLFYQTFIVDKTDAVGPSNVRFLLQRNELQRLFSDLSLLVYIEQGSVGDTTQGIRNEAFLVAQRLA